MDGAQRPVVKEVGCAAGERKCPKCRIALRTLNYAYDSGVMVDRCPQCDGLWLDEGELESLQIIVEEWEKRNPEITAKFASKLSSIQIQGNVEREAKINGIVQGHMGPSLAKNILKSILYRIF